MSGTKSVCVCVCVCVCKENGDCCHCPKTYCFCLFAFKIFTYLAVPGLSCGMLTLSVACRIWFPDHGSDPGSLHCECRVLDTVLPRKSHDFQFWNTRQRIVSDCPHWDCQLFEGRNPVCLPLCMAPSKCPILLRCWINEWVILFYQLL